MLCKNELHELRGPQDVTPQGECRKCFDNRQHRFQERRRHAVSLFSDIERRAIKLPRSSM